jgi:hypothetical protein
MPATSPEAKAHHKEYLRERRAWYKEHGICTNCLENWAAPGRTQCEACTKLIKERADRWDPGRVKRKASCRAYRERKLAEGLCVNCGKRPVAAGHTRCHTCIKKHREGEQVRRIAKRIAKKRAVMNNQQEDKST